MITYKKMLRDRATFLCYSLLFLFSYNFSSLFSFIFKYCIQESNDHTQVWVSFWCFLHWNPWFFLTHYQYIISVCTLLLPHPPPIPLHMILLHSWHVLTHLLGGVCLPDSELLCLVYYFPRAIHLQTFHDFSTLYPALYILQEFILYLQFFFRNSFMNTVFSWFLPNQILQYLLHFLFNL